MLSGVPPAASRNRRKLRNIASACSSGLGDITPVLASLPEIAEEKSMLPTTVPLGIGAPCSMPLMWMLFRFAIGILLVRFGFANVSYHARNETATGACRPGLFRSRAIL